MSYQALYRVWRPQAFSDVVGQDHIMQTLRNALYAGRLSHAYLFSGPRGTGKTSVAKILAKAVNCKSEDSKPCNDCDCCKAITTGAVMDVVEIDAASNRGVDEIRDLRDSIKYASTEVPYKVYIIDEVHMLTTEAFNALLKTLEEPPDCVLFILATTEPQKLPATIVSRCQRFSFRRIPVEAIQKRLKEICDAESIEAEPEALAAIGRISDGGMRDALSILDQCWSICDGALTEKSVALVTGSVEREVLLTLLSAIIRNDLREALQCLEQAILDGFDSEQLLEDMVCSCRDILMFHSAPSLIDLGEEIKECYSTLLDQSNRNKLLPMLDLLVSYQSQMKYTAHPRILLEVVIARLCETAGSSDDQVTLLEKRVAQIEKEVHRGMGRRKSERPNDAHVVEDGHQRDLIQRAENSVTNAVSLKEWKKDLCPHQLDKARDMWPDVLKKVKEQKITVHAWLVDGEVVGATKGAVVTAFRSKIHRETTEKLSHKELIEDVMCSVAGEPLQLVTCMLSEYQSNSVNAVPDKTQEKDAEKSEPLDDVLEQAIEIFGEELVEVCTQDKGE